jgi:hypothetical protein
MADAPAMRAPPGLVEVHFDLDRADYVEFSLSHHERSPSTRQTLRLLQFLMPALGVFMVLLLAVIDALPWEVVLISGPILLVLFLILPMLLRWSWRRRLRQAVTRMYAEGKNRGLYGSCQLTISPSGISQVTELRNVAVKWPAVEKIVESEHYAYIYVSAVGAFILPKAAFSSEADYRAFIAAARHYAAQAAPQEEQ